MPAPKLILLIKKVRGFIKIYIFFLWTFFVCLLFAVGKYNNWSKRSILKLWHQGCLAIISLKITIKGKISTNKKTLFVANHISYLDISALGSKLKASFIAKSEVRQIPIFGWLSTLQNTIFVDRENRLEIRKQMEFIAKHLHNSNPLILFAEGVSTQGLDVVPFKSSLFAITDFIDNLELQPISIIYKTKNGKNLSTMQREYFAFYQEIPFGKHFWRMACQKGIQVELIFHKPIQEIQQIPRKELADRCYKIVRAPFLK